MALKEAIVLRVVLIHIDSYSNTRNKKMPKPCYKLHTLFTPRLNHRVLSKVIKCECATVRKYG